MSRITRAIRATEPGGIERLQLDDVTLRPPGPGQARVRVHAAGVNFIDVYHRTGLYPAPVIDWLAASSVSAASPARSIALGQEGAGIVEEVGAGVDLAPGDAVAWAQVAGSYATHVIAAADRLVPVPAGLDLSVAAALMLQGMTAHYLTRSTFVLAPGHTCLLHAAAGGVGQLLAQLARRAGAIVIGTVSSDAKAVRARAAGCHHVIRYDRDDFVAASRTLTGGRGVDVIYDSVGHTTFLPGLDALRPRGMMVSFGQSSGVVAPLDPRLLSTKGSLFVTRPTLGHYVADRAELLARAGDVLGAAVRGDLTVAIDRTLPLADAGEAHRLLESRATMGKLLLDTH